MWVNTRVYLRWSQYSLKLWMGSVAACMRVHRGGSVATATRETSALIPSKLIKVRRCSFLSSSFRLKTSIADSAPPGPDGPLPGSHTHRGPGRPLTWGYSLWNRDLHNGVDETDGIMLMLFWQLTVCSPHTWSCLCTILVLTDSCWVCAAISFRSLLRVWQPFFVLDGKDKCNQAKVCFFLPDFSGAAVHV